MSLQMHIRLMNLTDAAPVADAFAAIGWNKSYSQYLRYFEEQERGEKTVLLAFMEECFAGYLTVQWETEYQPFRVAHIPEIRDLNVLPMFQRRGIGTRLMDKAERRIAERSAVAGIGVGMTPDYGAAQRMYVLRGYIPDGHGLYSNEKPVKWGDTITVDDDLVLYFTKRLF